MITMGTADDPTPFYPSPPPRVDVAQTLTVPRHILADAVALLELAAPRMGAWGDLQAHTIDALRGILAAHPPA